MYNIIVKIACYTCITGKYDTLKDPLIKQDPSIDFICFTDQPFKSNVWKIKPIPKELQRLSAVKQQRVIKICPHRYLPKKYNISLWIDGNVQIIGDLMQFIKQYDLSKNCFYTRIHPCRNCIYDEAKACLRLKKDLSGKVQKQIEKYKAENYPAHIGMVETCFLLRKHNEHKCQLIDNYWAAELLQNSHRDQLSFNYVCWKYHFLPGIMTKNFNASNTIFKLINHAK